MSNMGTIVYIGGFELPDKNAAAHRVLNNARAFRESGYNVVFCGTDKSITSNCTQKQIVDGFDSYPTAYPASTKQWVKQLLEFEHYENVISLYNDVRCVICYNLHAVPLKKVLSFAKKRGIQVIADCTEWYENKPTLNPIGLVRFVDTELCMKVLQKKCHGMIAISTYLEKYYKSHIDNIVVVPPLVDVTEQKWQQEPAQTDEKITFVYSGQPGDTKDQIGQIIESFLKTQGVENCVFRVVGITQQEFFKTYPHFEEKKTQIDAFVEFCGRVSHTQSIKELKSADYCVFVRNSTRKNNAGFPTKFVECYTSGVGIIANNISDIKGYFPNDGYSILIEENTDENIAQAIKQALQNGKPAKRNENDNPFDYHRWIDKLNNFLK